MADVTNLVVWGGLGCMSLSGCGSSNGVSSGGLGARVWRPGRSK